MLLIGPPGSGKTRRVLGAVEAAIRADRSEETLLLVPTSSMKHHLLSVLAGNGLLVPARAVRTMSEFVGELTPGARVARGAVETRLLREVLRSASTRAFGPRSDSLGLCMRIAALMGEFWAAGADSLQVEPGREKPRPARVPRGVSRIRGLAAEARAAPPQPAHRAGGGPRAGGGSGKDQASARGRPSTGSRASRKRCWRRSPNRLTRSFWRCRKGFPPTRCSGSDRSSFLLRRVRARQPRSCGPHRPERRSSRWRGGSSPAADRCGSTRSSSGRPTPTCRSSGRCSRRCASPSGTGRGRPWRITESFSTSAAGCGQSGGGSQARRRQRRLPRRSRRSARRADGTGWISSFEAGCRLTDSTSSVTRQGTSPRRHASSQGLRTRPRGPRHRHEAPRWSRELLALQDHVQRPDPPVSPGPFQRTCDWRETLEAQRALRHAIESTARLPEFKGQRVGFSDFTGALGDVLGSAVLSVRDQRYEVVHVLPAHEARQWSVPVAFVCGLVDGAFRADTHRTCSSTTRTERS